MSQTIDLKQLERRAFLTYHLGLLSCHFTAGRSDGPASYVTAAPANQ